MASNKSAKYRLVAKVVDGESGACAFCRQKNKDEVAFGKLYSIGDLYCHYFCVLLSCCLVQKGQDEDGLLGFLYTDIKAELERSKKHKCSYCGQEGATLGCSVSQCRKQFHLPCGRQRQAVSLFYGNYKSFCRLHAPRQKIAPHVLEQMKLRTQRANRQTAVKAVMNIISGKETVPAEEEEADVCVICYEAVLPGAQYFWPPCCARDARFHRSCLERMALSAGIHYLKCPLCNDKETFYRAVVAQGYYVPDRDAAWELEQGAFADIYNREVSCHAEECICPMGRGYDGETGEWDIKLCLLCGGSGVHAGCLPAVAAGRNVCASCQPAAPTPTELAHLEEQILKVQEEEQQRAVQAPQSRRIMPSRMSLRRPKGAVVSTSRNWRSESTSATKNNTTDKEEYSITAASRSQLNLKTPRRVSRSAVLPPAPKLEDESLMSPLKYLRERLATARAHLDDKMANKLRRLFKKPRPLSHKRRVLNAIVSEILLESHKVRSPLKEWNTPRKLESTPKKREKSTSATKYSPLRSPKQASSLLEDQYISPKWTPSKSSSAPDAEPKNEACSLENHKDPTNSSVSLINKTPKRIPEESPNAKINVPTQNTADSLDGGKDSYKSTALLLYKSPDQTPSKCSISKNTATMHRLTDSVENVNESTNNIFQQMNKTHKQTPKKSPIPKITPENGDESSNSTFQLPSDFVAENISDDELIGFDNTSSCVTVQIEKDSSMEISNQEAKINIDLVKIDSENESTKILKDIYVKSPERSAKCSYKFSPTDKEVLEIDDVGIDVESFKGHYLNEVDQDFKSCAYSHKHDNKVVAFNRLRTPIDYALEAFKKRFMEAARKQVNEDQCAIGNEDQIVTTEIDNSANADRNTEENKNLNKKCDVEETTNGRATVNGSKKRSKHNKNRDYVKKRLSKKQKMRYRKEGKNSMEQQAKVDDGILDNSATSLKRKKCNEDSVNLNESASVTVNSAKRPKLETAKDAKRTKVLKYKEKIPDSKICVGRESKHARDKKYTESVRDIMLDHSDDHFEPENKSNKDRQKKSESKEERRLRKLKRKQKKDNRYHVKCKKRQRSVKIQLVYNERDATDNNCINLTLKSKKEKKKIKHIRSMTDEQIKLKIKFKTDKKKKHKNKIVSPNALRQTLLNFSPENVSTSNCLMRPKEAMAPIKKRIYVKKEMSTDSLKQTSIQNFFNKVKTTVKEEAITFNSLDEDM